MTENDVLALAIAAAAALKALTLILTHRRAVHAAAARAAKDAGQ